MKLSKSYPFFPIEKKSLNRIYFIIICIISSFLLLLSVSLIFLQFLLDKEIIRDMISKEINESTNFLIRYEDVETIIFPLPGIQITNVQVSKYDYPLARINRIKIYWNIYALLLKKFELDSMSIEEGELNLLRNPDGSFPSFTNLEKEKEKVDEIASDTDNTPDGILGLMPNTIYLNNFRIRYIDQRWNRADQVLIESFEWNTNASDRFLQLKTDFYLNSSQFIINADYKLSENSWSLDSSKSSIQLRINSFYMNNYLDLLSIFPKANFSNSTLNVALDLTKSEQNQITINLNDLSLVGLESSGKKKIPDIHLDTRMDIDLKEQNLNIEELNYTLLNKAKLYMDSKLSWKDKVQLTSKIHTDNLDLDSTLAWVNLLSTVDKTKSNILTDLNSKEDSHTNRKNSKDSTQESISSKNNEISRVDFFTEKPDILIKLDINKLLIGNQYIHKLTGNITGNQELVNFKELEILLYDGKVNVEGSFRPKAKGQNLNLIAELKGIDMKKLLARVSSDSLITGKMYGKIDMSASINANSSFMNTMDLKSNFNIKNGELLGYANFIRPVAEIGKVVNFTQGNSGKSTSFHSITANVNMRNQTIYLKNFDMQGVGINAIGSGVYNMNGKVDMKFTASLPGLAGKAFKIPILYKGILGKNVAFIDPVWMASVYVGSVIFAGPAGAVIGGLAGSASSDAVEKASEVVSESYDSAKNFLFGKDKKK